MHDRHVSICIIGWDSVHSIHSTCRNVTQALQVYSWLFLELCTEPQMTWKCHTSPTSVGLPFPWFVYLPCRPLWPMKVAPSIVRQVYSCLFLELCTGFAGTMKTVHLFMRLVGRPWRLEFGFSHYLKLNWISINKWRLRLCRILNSW